MKVWRLDNKLTFILLTPLEQPKIQSKILFETLPDCQDMS